MKFTNRMKVNGELAMRDLSDKAMWYYDKTDPIAVYEYEIYTDDEEADTEYRYAIERDRGNIKEGLTFEQVQEEFEEFTDIFKEEIIKELFEAMKNDIGVMSEHGDSEKALWEELTTANAEILEIYKDLYL